MGRGHPGRWPHLLLATWLAGCAPPPGGADLEGVRRNFQSPPDAARPHTFWHWMNGHVGKEGITRDLEAMKAAGLGGFMLWNASEGIPPGPVDYMSPQWWALLEHTMAEAERLGLEMSMHNGAGWSASGGPWVTPDRAMQEVVWTERQVAGPAEFDGVLDIPEPALGIERDMKKDPEINQRYYVPREKVRGYYRDIRLFAFPTPPGDKAGQPWRLDNWREKAAFAKFKKDPVPDTRTPPPGEIIDPATVIDLTDKLDKDGRLRWSVPAGGWTLLRMGYQPTGRQNHPAPAAGRGLEIDKQSAAAADFFWDQSIAKIVALAGDRAGRTFRGVSIDSFEVGHQNWSAGFPEAFRAERGYDVHPRLIALTGRVLRSMDETEDFLWDFRKTTGDLIARNYYGRFAELSHKHGLQFFCEPYGHYGNTNDYDVAALADVPMCEWWAFGDSPYHAATAKLASSAAHTRGRAVVDSEAFTGSPGRIFEEHPAALKAQGDSFFCQGINRFSFHTFAHDPYDHAPGLGLGTYGSRFDRRNTWWPFLRPWMDYLARCQYLLRQGTFVADFLYYTGEDAPRNAKTRGDLASPPPAGFDFDFCDRAALMELEVRNGRLVLPSGMSYRVLVLPPSTIMSLGVVKKIRALAGQGAVVAGPQPQRAPGLAGGLDASAEVVRLGSEVWGGGDGKNAVLHNYGKGRVFGGGSMEQVAGALGLLPDFESKAGGIGYIHRRAGKADIYFVSNQRPEAATFEAVFRVSGRGPELWHPDTGRMETAAEYCATDDGRTAVTLSLDPSGSVFVVFVPADVVLPPPGGRGSVRAQVDGMPDVVEIPGPWKVSFQPGRGAPASIELEALADLSQHPDPGVKYFSGNATYRTDFVLPEVQSSKRKSQILLDLGGVQVIASVRLNGKDLGIAWKPPFQVEAAGALRPGRNELEIVVANLWVNRLIGDLQEPDDCEWTDKTGSTAPGQGLAKIPDWVLQGGPRPSPQRIAFAAWRWPHLAKKPLPPSGLIGPVRLVF